MLTLEDLIELERYYKTNSGYLFNIESFKKAVSLVKNELPEVLDTEREYPPFLYYLILSYLSDSYIKFSDLSNSDKIIKFNETIQELNNILHRKSTERMIEFLNQAINFRLPYKYRQFSLDSIKYSFNIEKHREDYKLLCEMMNLCYEEDDLEEYTLKILF